MVNIDQKYIAYRGQQLTLEWYCDMKGQSEPLVYFEQLPHVRKKKLIYLFMLLGNSGKIFNKEKFRYEGNQIYALKSSFDRFLCFFFYGSKVIITNAYEKNLLKCRSMKNKKLYAQKKII